MGCSPSMDVVKPTLNGASNHSIFTEKQKKIVIRNWKMLSNDLSGRGSKIFLRIFEMNPAVKKLFPCGHLEGEALLKDPHFKGHASRFMQAVGAVIDNIDNYEEALAPLLLGLGRQHIHFKGFQPDYWNSFESAILHVWREELASKFNTDAREAWHKVFQFILTKLNEGYQQALDEEEKRKPKGDNVKNLMRMVKKRESTTDAGQEGGIPVPAQA